MKRTSKWFVWMGILLVTATLLAACGAQKATPTEAPAPTAVPATEAPTAAPPTVSPAPAPSGDPIRGAKLYDNWMKELGVDVPEGNQPLWATQTTNTRTGADTWRCKECHGWDYLGVEGRYGSGSHKTGFPGIFAAKEKSPEELLAALKSENHDFSPYLGEAELNNLVAFIQQLQDLKPYINDDKTVNGNAEHGKALYSGTCAACHGEDGKVLNFGGEAAPEYVGTIGADNPWEAFNKIAYGQPGAPMPSGLSLGWSWQDIADVLAYIQTLPAK